MTWPRSVLQRHPLGALLLSGVLASLVLQLALAPSAGYDLRTYKAWEQAIGTNGLLSVYGLENPPVVYPPVYPYMLKLLTLVYTPPPGPIDQADRVFSVLMKLPMIFLNLGIGLLIFWLGRSAGFLRGRPVFAALSYLLNPAVIYLTGWQGSIDPLVGFFMTASFLAMTQARSALSSGLWALAVLTKPQALAIGLVIMAATALRGRAEIVRWLAGAMIVTLLVLAPFALAGNLATVQASLKAIGWYPFLSVNAHNIWWLASVWTGDSRIRDDIPLPDVPSLTTQALGLGGLVILTAIILVRIWRVLSTRDANVLAGPQQTYLLTSAIVVLGLGYFLLPTEIHDNHLYLVFPFLSILVLYEGLRPAAVALTLNWLFSLAVHDGSTVEITRQMLERWMPNLMGLWSTLIVVPDGDLNNTVSWVTGLSALLNLGLLGVFLRKLAMLGHRVRLEVSETGPQGMPDSGA